MLFAALLGGHLLGEGDRVLRLVGAAAIALGWRGWALGRPAVASRPVRVLAGRARGGGRCSNGRRADRPLSR